MGMNLQDRGVLPEEMRHTYSVCPVCLKRIPAKREERDGQIYLVKTCPDHGTFSSVIWRNKRKFADWRGERPAVGENENLNCPTGCGLCAELCPMGSIDPADVSQVNGICIKCCACVKGCPSGAKFFDDAGYLYHRHELEAEYARPAANEVFYIQL